MKTGGESYCALLKQKGQSDTKFQDTKKKTKKIK
jgi:hypothetical protein